MLIAALKRCATQNQAAQNPATQSQVIPNQGAKKGATSDSGLLAGC
jgi:hypothetical protein